MALHAARPFRTASLAALLWLCLAPARADVYDDVLRLIRAQNWAQAQALASQHLQTREQDPQMRLLLSRIQTGQGQTDAAMGTLLQLTLNYPELAEPHNNLAALYAQAGRFDDALSSLNRAILARPDYATALENLGDLHATLAQQAYERAAQAASAASLLTGSTAKVKANTLADLLQAAPR